MRRNNNGWTPDKRWKLSMRKPRTNKPTTLDIAWAAGIYEGEGSCHYMAHAHTISAMISQKDGEVVERFRLLFGGNAHRAPGGSCLMWSWRPNGIRAHAFLMTIYKFMSIRRKKQIKVVIDHEVAYFRQRALAITTVREGTQNSQKPSA